MKEGMEEGYGSPGLLLLAQKLLSHLLIRFHCWTTDLREFKRRKM
jgi:hypothetical protein